MWSTLYCYRTISLFLFPTHSVSFPRSIEELSTGESDRPLVSLRLASPNNLRVSFHQGRSYARNDAVTTRKKNILPSRSIEISTLDNIRLSTWILSSLDYRQPPIFVARLVPDLVPFPLVQLLLLRSLHVAQAWVCCLSIALALGTLGLRPHTPFLSRSLARADGLSAPSLFVLFAPRSVIVGDRSGADGRARCIY